VHQKSEGSSSYSGDKAGGFSDDKHMIARPLNNREREAQTTKGASNRENEKTSGSGEIAPWFLLLALPLTMCASTTSGCAQTQERSGSNPPYKQGKRKLPGRTRKPRASGPHKNKTQVGERPPS